ncbi:MAG: hypothetical protein Q3962_09470 [Corynebacterium sp.]|nr:hypothetical protein [Corynebacterium sp.]
MIKFIPFVRRIVEPLFRVDLAGLATAAVDKFMQQGEDFVRGAVERVRTEFRRALDHAKDKVGDMIAKAQGWLNGLFRINFSEALENLKKFVVGIVNFGKQLLRFIVMLAEEIDKATKGLGEMHDTIHIQQPGEDPAVGQDPMSPVGVGIPVSGGPFIPTKVDPIKLEELIGAGKITFEPFEFEGNFHADGYFPESLVSGYTAGLGSGFSLDTYTSGLNIGPNGLNIPKYEPLQPLEAPVSPGLNITPTPVNTQTAGVQSVNSLVPPVTVQPSSPSTLATAGLGLGLAGAGAAGAAVAAKGLSSSNLASSKLGLGSAKSLPVPTQAARAGASAIQSHPALQNAARAGTGGRAGYMPMGMMGTGGGASRSTKTYTTDEEREKNLTDLLGRQQAVISAHIK